MAEGTPLPAPAGGSGQQRASPLRDFAEIAVERGYCSAQQVAQARAGQPPGAELRTLLVQQGVLSEDQARACERATRGATIMAGFEILEKIGQGGMGAVFRARQINMDRPVALKILQPKLAQDPAFKQRFLQEAKMSAKLSHLNIINGIDCGESGGFTYFAMEYVDGKTVKQILKEKGKLPPAEAFSIVRQVAEALVYAESKSMVHRDIKPDNIMLTKEGKAKLCDLGLAKLQQDDSDVAQAGHTVGTPSYISPEQARGERNLDTRADIYSLGATFYHLLAGKTPFTGPTNGAVMALHISAEAGNPCDFDPLLPTSYGQIISKMMAKFPEDRYATAQELVNDLEAAKQKLVPKAAAFLARSSCSLPRRAIGYAEHEAAIGETAAGAPTLLSRAARVLAGLALLAALGAAGYWIWARARSGQVAEIQPVTPTRPKFDKPWADEPKSQKAVKPAAQESGAKPPPAEHPKVHPKTTPEPAPAQPNEAATVSPPPQVPVSVAQAPEPPAKSQDTAPKIEEPPAKAPEPPVVPPDENAPAVPPKPDAALVPTAKVDVPEEPPPAKIVSTPDMLYARFLSEFKKPAAKGELRRFHDDLKALAAQPEYAVARADINADLEDLTKAMAFEHEAVKAMAAAGGTIDLNEETARKFKVSKGKIVGYDPEKGIDLDMGGARTFMSATFLPVDDILKHAPDKSPAARISYLLARGYREEADGLLKAQGAALKPELLARYERKLRLLKSGEIELRAQAAFDNLAKVAEAKHWRTFNTMAADFDKVYGNTSVAAERVADLLQWRAAAKQVLSPPEGLEAAGKYNPLKWPGVNACDAKVVSDPAMGFKVLRIEGKTGASLVGEGDKSGVMRAQAPALNLEGKTKIVFRARLTSKTNVQIAFGFLFGGLDHYETQLALVSAGRSEFVELSIPIEGAAFKSSKTGYLNFDTALPSSVAMNMLILVYTKEPYVLELSGIAVR